MNGDIFDIIAWDIRKFSVSLVVKIRKNDVVIRMTTVYGSPYEDGKQEFISELHELFVNWDGPAIIRG